uniref:Uncharacterized protein n=1 Tax=viral metagenome TaxID=1070528 RepID=A0A6C0HGK6_9ZZZZ
MAKSHAGITVFRLKPMPNSRKLPSKLYKKAGCKATINPYKKIKITIDTTIKLLRIVVRNIYYRFLKKYIKNIV